MRKVGRIGLSIISFFFLLVHSVEAQVNVSVCPTTEPGHTICMNLGQNPNALTRLIQFAITAIFIFAILIAIILLIGGWAFRTNDKIGFESARNAYTAIIVGLIVLFTGFVLINIISLVFGIPLFSFVIPTI